MVKKDPFWTSIKKTSKSFWTSCFELIHCDWAMYFFTKPKLAFFISDFDWYFQLVNIIIKIFFTSQTPFWLGKCHVAFKQWPPKLSHVAFEHWPPRLCHMACKHWPSKLCHVALEHWPSMLCHVPFKHWPLGYTTWIEHK